MYSVSVKFHQQAAAPNIHETFMQGEEQSERVLGFICYILMTVFQASVVKLVKSYVEGDIEINRKASMASFERTAHRTAALKKWVVMSKPLGYDAFVLLSQTLHSSDSDVAKGLPFSDQKCITIQEFANLLYIMGRPDKPTTLGPPVIKEADFPQTLRSAVTYFRRHINKDDRECKLAFSRHISTVTANMSINFCPWSKGLFPTNGSTSGRRVDRKIIATSWVTLGAPIPQAINLPMQTLTPQEVIGVKLHNVQRRVMIGDARASWSLSDITSLSCIPRFIDRQIMPSDWTLGHCSLPTDPDNLITRTYKAMDKLMDLSQPHIACVFWTSVIFMHAVPTVGHSQANSFPRPQPPSAYLSRSDLNKQFTTFYRRNTPWIMPKASANATSRLPYPMMFTLGFLAWSEESSPLRQQGASLKQWNDKHRELRHAVNEPF
jgi:hypothetical protein